MGGLCNKDEDAGWYDKPAYQGKYKVDIVTLAAKFIG